MQITIRGQALEFNEIADTQIMPLARIFGTKKAPDEGTAAYEKWSKELTNVFMEPPNQAAVAYFLTSVFPEIEPAIARYRIKRFDEGYSEIDFYLAINAEELMKIIEVISPVLNARFNAVKAKNEPSGEGFAKPPTLEPKGVTKENDADAPSDRIKELEAENEKLRELIKV